MVAHIDAGLLAQECLLAQRTWPNQIAIRPYLAEEEGLAIINPFRLSLRLSDGNMWEAAIFFDQEYPTRVFPRVIAASLPSCPLHPFAPHPNFNALTGLLEIRPALAQPEIDVDHVVRFLRLLLDEPLHSERICEAAPLPASALRPVTSAEPTSKGHTALSEQKEQGWRSALKVIGEGAEVAKTIIELSKLVGLLVCLVDLASTIIK
jgi:hypothetical protein